MPIIIHPGKCDQADTCSCPDMCPQHAWRRDVSGKHWEVDQIKCVECGLCVHVCPAGAVIYAENEEEKQKILEEIKNDTVYTPVTLFVERYGGCPMTESVVVDTKSFDSKVSKGIVLVEFFNEDSIKCLVKTLPYHEFAPGLVIYKVDVKSNPDLKQRFGINLLPTLIIFDDGKEVDRIEGFTDDIGLLKYKFFRKIKG